MISIALLSLFFGLFTVLTLVAAYVLLSRSKGIKRKATAIMLAAIIVMWLSTVTHWIATLVASANDYSAMQDTLSRSVDQIGNAKNCLRVFTGSDAASSCPPQPLLTESGDTEGYNINGCTGTVSLMVNVVIGDSIVWWRAWVLWPNSRVVRYVCVTMILLTMMTGAAVTSDACKVLQGWVYWESMANSGPSPASVGFKRDTLLSEEFWGILAAVFSLLTNVVATTLIAYRVWQHRRVIKLYLKGSSRRSQVERTLALLVESGLLYCVLWVFITIYELNYMSPALNESAFTNVLYYLMDGCLVPFIGMYPTLIIIVCAVDKSLYEKSADDEEEVRTASMVFNATPDSNRRRGTLSELLSASSAGDATYVAASEDRASLAGLTLKDESSGSVPPGYSFRVATDGHAGEVQERALIREPRPCHSRKTYLHSNYTQATTGPCLSCNTQPLQMFTR
ncbi:hypothetical protein K466DRAFT_589968 [Polyporus arcularius HHB13444]|uniref:Uncharacterized protein n=1 Tax=Polyporus arcularius HHB13444 TaxID=1314778 RepID=A0A5C3P0J7_9APHY|nr:hypothetical protein K466DRAFT_589968 [Polyporus arcularius HHB13444]